MLKSLRIILFASLTVMVATGTTGSRPLSLARFQDMGVVAPSADDPLSVMTYNVRGLPWPIAWGRADALAQIGDRLAALRRAGRQPHILLLQEAFTPEARAIAARAGYAHVVAGPDRRMRGPAPVSARDRTYLARARWDRGEAADKQFGSGLLILSDYPILSAARLAFPAHACAGFDCLANKGALVARLAVPGMAQPVHVVNTHLNARKAAGVPIARSQRAFERQVDLLTRFVRAQVPQDAPLILGGDMNIGRDPARLFRSLGGRGHGLRRTATGRRAARAGPVAAGAGGAGGDGRARQGLAVRPRRRGPANDGRAGARAVRRSARHRAVGPCRLYVALCAGG